MAFASIEPFGPEADDLRHGIACATIVNSNPYRRRGSRTIEPRTFMLSKEQERDAEPQSPDEIRATLEGAMKRNAG